MTDSDLRPASAGSHPTAVVTGASSGIGRATAARLVADGWRVLAVARRQERLEELAANTGCDILAVDVTDDDSVARLVERVDELFGGTLNSIVHVAGGALGVEPAAEADLDHWQRMYDINVLGAVRVTRALLPAVRASRRGDVLFVTSVAAHEAYEGGSGYNAAKAGEHMLARALRLELNGERIRVIEVAPHGYRRARQPPHLRSRRRRPRRRPHRPPPLQPRPGHGPPRGPGARPHGRPPPGGVPSEGRAAGRRPLREGPPLAADAAHHLDGEVRAAAVFDESQGPISTRG